MDTSAKRLAIREALGQLLSEGDELAKQCLKENESQPSDEAERWNSEAVEYLDDNCGSDYVARFSNSAGLPMVSPID